MFDSILVPTDGSEASETTGSTAIVLANRFQASIEVLNVVEQEELPQRVLADASADQAEHGEAAVGAIANRATADGIPTSRAVIESAGALQEQLIEYGTEHDVDRIVMGTHGRTRLNRLVLGSVAEWTLRESPVPVLTVHEDSSPDPDFEKILVPTDGSKHANAAVERAIQMASEIDSALHIVHVVNITAVSGEYGSGEILQALEESGQRAVDDAIDRAEHAGVRSIEATVLSGRPAKATVDYATDHDVSLVVMGTHGRSGLARYLLGSVTEKVVRVADMPVLTVAPPDTD
jgi:nucleotide-binding universal stress UspA family protein